MKIRNVDSSRSTYHRSIGIPLLVLLLLPLFGARAQQPIIDMHLHALPIDFQGPPPQIICSPFAFFPAWDPQSSWREQFSKIGEHPGCDNPITSPTSSHEVMTQTLAILDEYNIIGVTSGSMSMVEEWRAAAPERIIPGLMFPPVDQSPSPDDIRNWHEEGRISILSEVVIQYQGLEPDDPTFEPYLTVAEEADMPVGIHIGTGPPGAPYLAFPEYRARMHSPLSLEEPLLRHPKLRIYVMHAGWPMLDDMLALMYAHPQVYVGVGVISHVLPTAEFHRYLRRLVEAGFGNRIMFGSDQMIWPETIKVAIASIESAEFLSDKQKRDIFYNNAARFLRLPEDEIARHHRR